MGQNREQRRAENKGTIRMANLLVICDNGNVIPLDITTVTVIDKNTGKPLFKPAGEK